MKVTYLNHSGFLVEWEHCYWIFDYYKGILPELDCSKDIFVFCSHSHEDHFNQAVFAWKEKYPRVVYVFSNQIRKTCEKLGKKDIIFIQSRKDLQLKDSKGNILEIHALQSTDCGCAFFIHYLGRNVYHAGDLHWWYWSGEDAAWNKKMTADYKKEMEYLEGRTVDLAFTPLDPRQGKDYALGINYLLEKVSIKHVFPMHFWDDFRVMERYLKENCVPERTEFHCLQCDGQEIELMI